MPLADDRDPASRRQANPDNPAIRNPYGSSTWTQGGVVLGHGLTGQNSYGTGTLDYSGQAAQAYDRAARTLRDVRQAQMTNLAPGQNPAKRSVMMDAFNNFRPTRPVMAVVNKPKVPPPPASQEYPSTPAPAADRKMVAMRKMLEQMDVER
jgi:hypothetical protein